MKKVLLEDAVLRLLLAISIIFAIMFSFAYAEIWEVIVTFVATAIVTFISLKKTKKHVRKIQLKGEFMFFQGLNKEQVEESRKKYGSNEIIEAEPETFWQKLKNGFEDPMIRLLLGVACIFLVMYFFGYTEIYESIGIFVAILLVTIITAKTEMASDKEYKKLKDSTKKETCTVWRDGVVTVIDSDSIVVGDLIILQSGNKIPADGILYEGTLKVDNSALNGETEEAKKYAIPKDYVYEEKALSGDIFVDPHSLFRGAVVTDGEGVMEVKKVGMSTIMGKMAEDMAGEEVDSPLKVKLRKLAKQISTFGYIGAVVIAVALMIQYVVKAGGVSEYMALGGIAILKDFLEAASLAIVIVVCAVPEGLPLMISLVLMQNTSKMLQHQVLVRKPIGIETAGSLNLLCSDKTGTITKGELEVVDFIRGDGSATGLNFSKDSTIKHYLDLAIGKNTAAMFDNNHLIVGGNATDKALLKFLTEDVFNILKEDASCAVSNFQGFNSANKFSSASIDSMGKTFYKGAPEKILAKAKRYIDKNGKVQSFDQKQLENACDELAKRAMRLLAFGYSEKPLVENEINDDLVLIGVAAIRDDVRPEAKEAIEAVQDAGIQVMMITGDRKETAVSIATDARLLKNENDIALTSSELNAMTDEELKLILKDIKVIARALPTDKSRIVRLAQEMNLVVGMTGDGVNDSPALKKADVGFAMGSGTDVAKEAGEIVILDDNFKSIKDAILYGRTIYHNILKFCKFQLVINVSAVAVSALAPFFGIEEPLKVTHLLWINLVMDALGSLALGNEPALKEYLKEKPRRRDENIISKKMMVQIGVMGAWLTLLSFVFLLHPWFRNLFESKEAFYTGYFSMFILCAVANGFNVRNDHWNIFKGIKENQGFLKIMGIIVLVQVGLTFLGGEFFACTPFGFTEWGVIILLALTMIPVDMIRKAISK